MAKQIRVHKELHGNRIVFVPSDPYSEELMDGLKFNVDFNLALTGARKRSTLNIYWAGLALLVQNFGSRDRQRWPSSRILHDTMMLALGYVHRLYFLDPKSSDGVGWREVPDSIAIDSMDDDEFDELFETIRGQVVKRFGFDPWDAWREEKDAQKANQQALGRSMKQRAGRTPPPFE